MAQQDTGLGWSAKDNWLISAGNFLLANLMGEASKFPVPATHSLIAEAVSPDQYTHNYIYAGVVTGSSPVYMIWYASETPSLGITPMFYSESPFIVTYYAGTAPEGGFASQFTGMGALDNTLYLTYYTSPFAYDTWTFIPAATPTNGPDIFANPTQAQLDSYATAILAGSSSPIYKLNIGYAVATITQWASLAGDMITTPVLISTDRDAVILSDDGATERADQLISEYRYGGLKFYMSFLNIRDQEFSDQQAIVSDLSQFGAAQPRKVFELLVLPDFSNVQIITSPDPYEDEGGETAEDGGDGEELEDDDMGIEAGSDFPSAINTGFCRIFTPSESDLRDLSNYLWSSSYDLAQVKKLFSNPMDSILGLSAVPIRLLGSSVSFSLGGVPITGMTLPMVTQQRYTYHMGSITIKERWGSYLDYDPYTKFSIFLPFIGMRELAADDIMGKTVILFYDIDILTGMCVARLQAGTNCLYEWGGNCAIQLPINSRNWDSVFSTAVSAVGGIVSAVTGGSAPLVAGSVASAALQTVSMKPRIDKSSTIGGAAGWLGQMTPYIIRTTPEAFIPNEQNKFIGYPAYINVNLGAISGYNEVESIHLENIPATGAELDEIETILKGGAIF